MSLDKIIVLVFVALALIGIWVLRRNSPREKKQNQRQDPQQSS